MKPQTIGLLLTGTTAALLLFAVPPAAGEGNVVHVFISNGVKAVMDQLRPQAEQAVGRPLAIEFGTTASLLERINGGVPFDAAVLTSEAITGLMDNGKLKSGSLEDLARCGIGVGMRAGAAKPDIHTAEALKRTLRNAKSITFAQEGASRAYLEKMFEHFGIADEMRGKRVLTPSSVKSNALVRDGEAEFILTLVSEILPAQGVELVGPGEAGPLGGRQLLAQQQVAGGAGVGQEQLVLVIGVDAQVVLAEVGGHGQLVADPADAQIVAEHLGHRQVVEDDREPAEVLDVLHDAEVLAGWGLLVLEHLQGDRRDAQRPDRRLAAQQPLGLFQVQARPPGGGTPC